MLGLSCSTQNLLLVVWRLFWFLVPWPGIKPRPSVLGAWNLSHWTTREWGAPKSLQMVIADMKLKDTCSLEEKLWQTQTRVCLVKAIVFPVVMYRCELDHNESWVPKNWCFWTVVLEKTLESPLDSKEIKPVNSKGNHYWIFSGRTDAEAETPILLSPDVKNWLIGKDPEVGKGWRQKKKGMI